MPLRIKKKGGGGPVNPSCGNSTGSAEDDVSHLRMRLQLAAAAVLCVTMPVAGSVADKIGFFNPTDTVARFPPAASAQDIAQAPCSKVLMYSEIF